MADHTKIEWTDATWNPITGCSVVSPGCTNCYAMRLAGTRLAHHPSRSGLTQDTKSGPIWTGEVRFNAQWLDQPLRWTKPRRIFVCAHGDLFAEGVPNEWLDQIFAVMALAPQHAFQVLAKRPERMRDYLSAPGVVRRVYEVACELAVELDARVVLIAPGIDEALAPPGPRVFLDQWPLPNVWLGVSVEDQRRADERIPLLLETPAAVRWISAEPLLGPVDLSWVHFMRDCPPDCEYGHIDPSTGCFECGRCEDTGKTDELGLDWVVAGGESGPNARAMHPDWARSLRDQCASASVPFLFKQWGEWWPTYDRDSEDPDWRRCDLAARQTPHGRWLNLAGGQGFHGDRLVRIDRIGKTRAGRRLDGIEHDGYPEVMHG